MAADTPPPADREQVTKLLVRWADGDAAALDLLMPLVYGELRKTAGGLMGGGPERTLQPTALVHEAWLRLVHQDRVSFEHRKQFYGLAAQVMRRILVDHVRAAHAEKRGGGAQVVPIDDTVVGVDHRSFELLDLDRALTALAALDPRQAQVIDLRYFGGLTTEETAATLGLSPSTVARAQRLAEAWLSAAMSEP